MVQCGGYFSFTLFNYMAYQQNHCIKNYPTDYRNFNKHPQRHSGQHIVIGEANIRYVHHGDDTANYD